MNADIGEYVVDFVDEPDDQFNPVGAKGLSEVAQCGVAAAVGNAIYHAIGRRLRRLPIHLADFHDVHAAPGANERQAR